MKKTIATIALSSLALLPATSAWAGGGSGTSTKDVPSDRVSSVTRDADGPSAERPWAVGCHQGYYFWIDIDHNNQLHGHWTSVECDKESFTFL